MSDASFVHMSNGGWISMDKTRHLGQDEFRSSVIESVRTGSRVVALFGVN